MKYLSNLVNELTKTLQDNKTTLLFINHPYICKILDKLIQEGFIYSYGPVNNEEIPKAYKTRGKSKTKYILIHLKYYYNNGAMTFLENYQGIKLYQRVTYKELVKLRNYTPTVLLDTGKGILTQSEALQKKQGGIILFIVL